MRQRMQERMQYRSIKMLPEIRRAFFVESQFGKFTLNYIVARRGFALQPKR
ncbi:Uncharacterised protein [Kluyvera cryocrescens]|uniref:Uncharacterized protein n=1 Tax=Kluyvera cryocrescens TaxID=580 RepID=A0A485A4D8_KLUCR|nr:Uncharacterised protein [Kluyvera cryocrescens]